MEPEGMPPLWAWKPTLLPLVSASMAELMREPSAAVRRRVLASWAEHACECVRGGLGADHPAAELASAFLSMLDESASKQERARAERHFVHVAEAAFSAGGSRR